MAPTSTVGRSESTRPKIGLLVVIAEVVSAAAAAAVVAVVVVAVGAIADSVKERRG
jgi:uncharacterized membrane-anchored protein